MFDFAGQAVYYACHQIYLSPRCFYLLVLDMSKDMDTLVNVEVCEYKRSIFSTWTYRDYLLFWLKSIHTFTSQNVPVILVGTHADGMSEKDIDVFYTNVWRIISEENKSLLDHIDNERTFTIGFDDKYNDSPSKILESISRIIQKQNYWGEELPSSWVILLSKLRKTKLKLCYLKKIKTLINLNMEITEVEDALTFFHEIGHLLFYNEKELKEIIILDIQWFADAFKFIIADETHVQTECKRKLVDEWDAFNKTGELSDALLEAMWKSQENNEYMQYKHDIILYMERLGMMTPIPQNIAREKIAYYVPCMNKRPIPAQCRKYFSFDLIHCFRFAFLPVFIFHRLVVSCMSLSKWKLNVSGQEKNIYRTAAVFVYANHHVILAISRNDIQVQVLRLKPNSIDQLVVFKVLDDISNQLEKLASSFFRHSEWIWGIKCKYANIAENSDNSFTKLDDIEDMDEDLFCTSCSVTHKLVDKELIEDYIKFVENRRSFLTSKRDQEHLKAKTTDKSVSAKRFEINFQQLEGLIQIGREALKMVFDENVPSEKLCTHLTEHEYILRRGHYCFNKEQLRIVFPDNGAKPNSNNFDITILYKLLRNTTEICETGVWRKELGFEHNTVSDDVERIKKHRNDVAHSTSKEMGNDEFQSRWLDLSKAIERLSKGALNGKVGLLSQNNVKEN
ncbi:uncharacterized protein LOC134273859 [Saccostrea cucullata]|uniref:uncharacterized protein LOC134273859 n=1 Tax=Saccostrea cuccullata TaxID=36930 RepID=UPI002ED55E4A